MRLRRTAMWDIISLINNDRLQILLTDKVYTVGRKDTDLILGTDPSISRKHASLCASHTEANTVQSSKLPLLTLTDCSKLGTVINTSRIKGEQRVLNSGDEISFGTVGSNKYRVEYTPFWVTTSCVAGAIKRNVRTLVTRLGGHIVPEWIRGCELLIMANLNVTVKVVAALVSQKHIVTLAYLEDLIKSMENGSERPVASSYLPMLTESQLDPQAVSFHPNPKRQKVFEGKLFLFLNQKQLKKLELVIELAGGTPMLLDTPEVLEYLAQPHSCVMQPDQAELSQLTGDSQRWQQRVTDELHRHGKRYITDPEVGFAILYCSTEKHCNPSQSQDTSASQSSSQMTPILQLKVESKGSNSFVPDTDNFTQKQKKRQVSPMDTTHIDETVRSTCVIKPEILTPQPAPRGTKRAMEEETVTSSPLKKTCIKEEPLTSNSSTQLTVDSVADAMISNPAPPSNKSADVFAMPRTFPRIKSELPSSSSCAAPTFAPETQEDDDFSTLVSRRTRKASQLGSGAVIPPSAVPVTGNPDPTDFDNLPSRRRQNQRTTQPLFSQPTTSDVRTTSLSTPVVTTSRPSTPRISPTSTKINGVNDDEEDEFLSAKTAREGVPDVVTVKEEDLPSRCIVIQEVPLVCRRRQVLEPVIASNAGNAQVGKNFKKFRKNMPGVDLLRTIIGGSDLMVHAIKTNTDMDQWLQDQLLVESQQTQQNKEADDFFELGRMAKRRR